MNAGSVNESATGAVPKGGPLDAARAFGVMLGPSFALDGLILAAAGAVAGTFMKRPESPRAKIAVVLAELIVAAPLVYLFSLRERILNWGSTPEERVRLLPGDELFPGNTITRAIAIAAPPEAVWPWIAQIGQERGGFYSYDWLENLAGCRMVNANEIHPDWQQRKVGETILLHPLSGLKVTLFEAGRALGIQGWGNIVVEKVDDRHSRLLIREPRPEGRGGVGYLLTLELPHFIMERKMLLGIRERAELLQPATQPRGEQRELAAVG